MTESQVVQSVIQGIEKTVDEEIELLGDLEKIRLSRIKAMKKRATDEAEWKSNGHGEYTEIPDEPAFFELIKKSKNVVLHFYLPTTERCKIVDMHLKRLAPQLIGTKFAKLNAEKAPFLTQRLKVRVIPTILGIIDKKVVDRLIGFTELGNCDDFTTEDLKTRLSLHAVIDYSAESAEVSRRKMKIEMDQTTSKRRQNLRNSPSSGSDDEDDEQHAIDNDDRIDNIDKEFELTQEELEVLNDIEDAK